MKENSEYRAEARAQLKKKWLMAVLVMLISWIIIQAFSSRGLDYRYADGHLQRNYSSFRGYATIISFILSGPLSYGVATYFLKLTRSGEPLLEDLFGGFKYFVNTFLLHLITTIFIILWMLLLVIPGIIAAFRYSMAYYIMNDNPGMPSMEAINLSKAMMKGHKGKLFGLMISFIGWALLSLLTLGIGLLWVGAYYNAAKVNFYEDLKTEYNSNLLENT